ncbi:hypothetical protein NFI96_008698, partial [Prochilodus magdalenae]
WCCPGDHRSIVFPSGVYEGNQEATNPVDAMAQSYTPAQFPPPPQNGIPGEFAAPHALPTQDFTGQNRVPEHTLTLYTPTQTHSDPTTNDSSRPTINTNTNSAPTPNMPWLTDCMVCKMGAA